MLQVATVGPIHLIEKHEVHCVFRGQIVQDDVQPVGCQARSGPVVHASHAQGGRRRGRCALGAHAAIAGAQEKIARRLQPGQGGLHQGALLVEHGEGCLAVPIQKQRLWARSAQQGGSAGPGGRLGQLRFLVTVAAAHRALLPSVAHQGVAVDQRQLLHGLHARDVGSEPERRKAVERVGPARLRAQRESRQAQTQPQRAQQHQWPDSSETEEKKKQSQVLPCCLFRWLLRSLPRTWVAAIFSGRSEEFFCFPPRPSSNSFRPRSTLRMAAQPPATAGSARLAASAKETPGVGKWENARNGAVLQMVEAATLGMPLEVWKTRMGRFREENTVQAFRNVYRAGGGGLAGVRAFWAGTSAKMVESASKGAVLMVSKEWLKTATTHMGFGPSLSGFLAGAGGGVCQVTVMGPCTFLVTSVVTSTSTIKRSVWMHARDTYRAKGIRGFYPGGVPIAFRQATNWASRQGFTDMNREFLKKLYHEDPSTARLTVKQEFAAGILGGAMSCWNHPFEVARIEAQARAAADQPKIGMLEIFRQVTQQYGVAGLFKGVVPRLLLGIYQTTFMVTGAHLLRHYLLDAKKAA
eukprot:m.186850 g.186850  ORF g.186850 m.186850 type:complete len:580 (-) comp21610_c1_seq2:26-1765(-)